MNFNWVILSAFAAFFWALVTHTDKYLISRYAKNSEPGALLIFSALAGVPVVIAIGLLVEGLNEIKFIDILFAITAGIVFIMGLIPYIYALENDETSNVAPLFLLAPLFSLVLARLILGEIITTAQLIGMGVLLFGSFWISIENDKKIGFRFKTLLLMTLASVAVALNALLFKGVYELDTKFWVIVFWEHIGYVLAGCALMIYKPFYKQFKLMLVTNKSKIIGLNIVNEGFAITGNFLFHYATLLTAIALVETVAQGLEPIFVLLIGLLISALFPKINDANITRYKTFQKLAGIILMIVGLQIIQFGF